MTDGTVGPEQVREALRQGGEIDLLDVREEHPYAQGHPLWAANLPLSLLELDAWARLPRLTVPIVVQCAYTPYAPCPLAPPGNELPVRVEAGERLPVFRGTQRSGELG